MFGMMFADLGQGLLLSLLGLGLFYTVKTASGPLWMQGKAARIVGKILVPIGLSAALFGALFGSCFAREDIVPALWFHPMEMVPFYLAMSIGIGMLTISSGLILSLVNTIRMGADRPWFWDKFGLLGLIFYVGFILLAVALLLQHSGLATSGAILCGLMLTALMGHTFVENRSESMLMRLFLSLLEGYDMLIKFFVQTLSFARIAAFTLAHIGLSMAVVIMADSLTGWPLLALIVMVLGNLFIIVLEGLLVSIQVVRLHFFEFFTKFVVGGGKPFTPLTLEEASKC
jgi:V/A-type H+-transporting ATPase subunit I